MRRPSDTTLECRPVMSFCPQCGAAAPSTGGTCPQCAARLGAPRGDDLRRDALNLLLVVASMLMAATFALIMLLVSKWEDIGNIPAIMEVGIVLTRVATAFAVTWFARLIGRPRPALLGALSLAPVADVLITGSLLMEARERTADSAG